MVFQARPSLSVRWCTEFPVLPSLLGLYPEVPPGLPTRTKYSDALCVPPCNVRIQHVSVGISYYRMLSTITQVAFEANYLSLAMFASTIIWINSSKPTLGFQPNSFLAFEESPIRGPVSVGLINLLSITTQFSHFSPK